MGTSKVTLTVDGNLLKRIEVAPVLRNTQKHSHVVVGIQKVFDARLVAAFRKFCSDFFDEAAAPGDPLELARHGADLLRGKLDEVRALMNGSKYPFVTQLQAPAALLDEATAKPDEWYLSEFDLADELLEAKENLLDPIQAFLRGGQRAIYDDGVALLAENANNLSYLPVDSDQEVRALIEDPNAFRGNRMSQLRHVAQLLRSRIDDAVTANRAAVIDAIRGRKSEVVESSYFASAGEEARQRVLLAVDRILEQLGSQTQIALIREQGNSFEETTYPALLDDLAAATEPTGDGVGTEPLLRQTVFIKSITVRGVRGPLESPEDINDYVEALRHALLDALDNGKRIAL